MLYCLSICSKRVIFLRSW
uniref:Uncharacterized protein n=1 Tax=Rhizophora mucronata TaxID=61149 RepID=A0A2P2PKR2_RHIMU